jgi:hypothetical protein
MARNHRHSLAHAQPRTVAGALRLFWLLAVLWLELGTYVAQLRACAWPDAALVRLLAYCCADNAEYLTLLSRTCRYCSRTLEAQNTC